MKLPSWLRKWVRRNVPTATRRPPQRLRRPVVEPLETRTLLSWIPIGPAPITNGITPGNQPTSGRVTAIVPDPTDAKIVYLGTAGGGVWKTTNYDQATPVWGPITDTQPTLVIGALAATTANSMTVLYAGTGEANFGNDSSYGRGVLKSLDGGATWTLLGNAFFERKVIARIVIDPTNANIVYVAVAGGGNGGLPGGTGIWKTTDGGSNWTNVTAAAGLTSTEAYTDLVFASNAPDTLYAAIGTPIGSAANGIYKTTNGGTTWTLVGGGLPSGVTVGRSALAVSKNNSQILYVSIAGSGQTGSAAKGDLFKFMSTSDGGTNWTDKTATTPNYLHGFGENFNALAIDPSDSRSMTVLAGGGAASTTDFSNSVIRTTNGGTAWTDISKEAGANGKGPHNFHAAIAFDKNNKPLDGNGGGVWRLDAVTPTWTDLNNNLQIGLMIAAVLDPASTLALLASQQNNGTLIYPGSGLAWNRSDFGNGNVRADFNPAFTPAQALYHEFQIGFDFFRISVNGGATWSDGSTGINTADPSNTFPPFVIDPANQARLLLGTNRVYERFNNTSDGLRSGSWTAISQPGNNGWVTSAPIDAVAIPKTNPNLIYATAGGRVMVGTKSGSIWTWIEQGPVKPFNTNIRFVDLLVDPTNANVVTVVAANFNDVTGGGRVWRSTTQGATWSDISGNLPNLPVHAVELNPQTPTSADDVLYVGTDSGVYATTNVGASWSVADVGLPNVEVTDLDFNARLGVLAAATHGRGVWELRNGSISGTKFNDTNGDGVQDTGEPGLPGWTIFLDANDDGVFQSNTEFSTTTDSNGNFVLPNLFSGTFRVREVLKSGWVQTKPPPDTTVLGSGQNVGGIAIGNFRTMSIAGQKFRDTNGNGVKDGADVGLSNWVVYLDLDNDGIRDSGEPTVTTSASGDYAFTDLGPATYRVREVLQSGWSQTRVPPAFLPVSGQNYTAADFGNFQLITISGRKFNDLNGNGSEDGGEPRLQDWAIFFDSNNDGIFEFGEPVTFTDSNGDYSFTNLGPDLANLGPLTYRVRENQQTDWVQTAPAAPVNVVATSGTNRTVVFGNFLTVTVSGTKYEDRNGNRTRDGGEPGLPNWVIFLDADDDGVLDVGEQSATTNAAGNYTMTNAGPGTFKLREVAQTGWVQTTAAPSLPLVSGQDRAGQDVGNFRTVSVRGQKFGDTNGNGMKDGGEVGLPGWVIQLDAGADGNVDATATTDGNGNYTFTNVGAGTFRVRELLQAGWQQTTTNPADFTTTSNQNVNGIDFGNFQLATLAGVKFDDTNGNGMRDGGEPGLPNWVILLDAGANGSTDAMATTDTSGNYSFASLAAGTYRVREQGQAGWVQTTTDPPDFVAQSGMTSSADFGNFRRINLIGQKFEDVDGDGSKDATEPRLPGWVIQLDAGADGSIDATATTGAGGDYSFPNLGPGTYRLREVGQTGWVQATADPADITAQSGSDATTDFGNFRTFAIRGQKFGDADNDGVRDGGEVGVAGWFIQLDRGADGTADASVTTDANGFYTFPDLGPGTYRVREVAQVGWKQTTADPADIPAQSGIDVGGVDFGNFRQTAARGSKFDDRGGDGGRDLGDPGLSGWTLYLDADFDDTFDAGEATATTDANGDYTFFVDPGTYRVREVQQSGWLRTTADPDDFTVGFGGPDVTGLDFGNFKLIAIAGQKFNDRDGDGSKGTGEPGLPGWVIQLDSGADGTADAIATTDAAGNYRFANLLPGTYRVREVAQTGWVQTSAAPADILAQSGTDVTTDFGNFRLVTLSGQKFNDRDGDGIKDAGETLLPGWVIELDRGDDGMADDTATTDGSGTYRFLNVGPGTYRIREVPQASWTPTVAPGLLATRSGVSLAGLDFGNFRLVTFAGSKFNDLNGNGVRNSGEPGLAGWVIQLDRGANGSIEAEATTDANGDYTFTNFGPGTYRIREVGQGGWVQSTTNPTDVIAASGVNTGGILFGNFQTVTFSGQKYEDTNGNGTRDAGEPGLPGWVIQLDRGANGTVDATATTDANGMYSFPNLGPGTYRVREVAQTGWALSSANPTDIAATSGVDRTDVDFGNFRVVTISGQTFDDINGNAGRDGGEAGFGGFVLFLDANNNGMLDTGEVSTTSDANGNYSFPNLGAGTYRVREAARASWVQTTAVLPDIMPMSGMDVTGVSVGNFRTISISGRRYEDRNGNGRPDNGEGGVPGGPVFLDADNDGTFDAGETNVSAAADGTYTFPNVGPGTYRVREVLQAGFAQATTNPADIPARSGQNVSGVDFGVFLPSVISGTVFEDVDGGGVRNPGEPGAAGFVIQLDHNADGTVDAMATTDAAGNYSFPNLGAGTYRVREAARAGWTQTTANPSDIVATSGSTATADFGSFRLFSVSGRVFEDTNGNDFRDPGEPSLPFRTVRLDSATISATTTTDASGNYTFSALGPGYYRVLAPVSENEVITRMQVFPAMSGLDLSGLDLGVFRAVRISGRVFADGDASGTDNGGTEPGIAGVTVLLFRDANDNGRLDGLDAFIATTTTAGDGTYAFLGRGPSRIFVVTARLPGRTLTTPADGAYTVETRSGVDVSSLDFGLLASAEQSYVFQLYVDLLGRRPEPDGLRYWTGRLDAGASRTDVARAIADSLEYKTKTVNSLFFSLLGRQADAAGLTAGLTILGGTPLYVGVGDPVETLKLLILTSPEYFQKQGGDNTSFLRALYRDLLHREADAPGLLSFSNALAGGVTRGLVARVILESTEGLNVLIDGFYEQLLRRPAEPLGLDFFRATFRRGRAQSEVLAIIAASDEYFARL